MFFSAAKSLREGALHSQPSDDLVTLARRVISADADEIFSVLASVDASFVAAQTAIALESTCGERRYRETQMALAHVNRVATSVSILICHLAVSTCRGISNLEL